MGVSTASAATHITPGWLGLVSHVGETQAYVRVLVAVKTFFKHAKRRGQKLKDGDTTEEATDDILFDEYVCCDNIVGLELNFSPPSFRAFHIVKAFIDLGTHNTVESLQSLYVLSYGVWDDA